MSHLEDLPDDRRAGKAGLPADDRDVTNGLVVPEPDRKWEGRPRCVRHGSMNRVDPKEPLYRCQMCGVGARWISNAAEDAAFFEEIGKDKAEAARQNALAELEVDPDGGHDMLHEFGRTGRGQRAEEMERFLEIWNAEDDVDLDNLPGYRYTLHHEVVIRFHWIELFRFGDGVMEAQEELKADPIGYAIDAYLEPHYDEDITEVVKSETRVEYDPDEEKPDG